MSEFLRLLDARHLPAGAQTISTVPWDARSVEAGPLTFVIGTRTGSSMVNHSQARIPPQSKLSVANAAIFF